RVTDSVGCFPECNSRPASDGAGRLVVGRSERREITPAALHRRSTHTYRTCEFTQHVKIASYQTGDALMSHQSPSRWHDHQHHSLPTTYSVRRASRVLLLILVLLGGLLTQPA